MSTFEEWLKANPPPDLQALVARWGSYKRIPPDVLGEFNRQRDEWEKRQRERLKGPGAR